MPQHLNVPAAVRELAASLAEPKPMRRGSLSAKCSKPGCPCATDPEARHGPCYSLTRAVEGRTQSRFVGPPEAPIVQRQIEAGQQFRRRVDAYWKMSNGPMKNCQHPRRPHQRAPKKGAPKELPS